MTPQEAYKAVRKLANKANMTFEAYCASKQVPSNTVYRWANNTQNIIEPKQRTLRKLGVVK